MEKNELVFPGDFIAYEEEFAAGKGAYEDSDGGGVFSSAIGTKSLDVNTHEASVSPVTKDVKILEKGALVYTIVNSVKPNVALVTILSAEKDGKGLVVHNSMASIAVFNIDTLYIRGIEEMFRAGDIVKARILEVTPYGIELSTKEPGLGVVKAFSIKTRAPLHLIDGKLRDPITGDFETRKISTEYSLR